MNSLVTSGTEMFLPQQLLSPVVHDFGARKIEITYLGQNSNGHATWILWNAQDPYLIGVLNQGGLGFTFEQRTSVGVMVHQHISLARIQEALAI